MEQFEELYIQFYEEVNLNEPLKVRKAPNPPHKCLPQLKPPTNLRKSQNVAFPGDFALRVREEQFKDYSKVEIATKNKMHF